MNIGIKDPCPVRTVGIMAGAALRFGYRIIHMVPDESRVVRLVASGTERTKIILQEMVRFARRVRIVAVQTPLFDRVMFKFKFCDLIPQGFMAAEAELVPPFEEIELVAGSVRIMTLHAISL